MVILEAFLGKNLKHLKAALEDSVSGERGSETEEDKGLYEERSSRR